MANVGVVTVPIRFDLGNLVCLREDEVLIIALTIVKCGLSGAHHVRC